jgi:hypothetical protein
MRARLGREAARRCLTEALAAAEVLWLGREEHQSVASALPVGSSLSLVDLVSIEGMLRGDNTGATPRQLPPGSTASSCLSPVPRVDMACCCACKASGRGRRRMGPV